MNSYILAGKQIRSAMNLSPAARSYILKVAYKREFSGNYIEITNEAAEAWAKDYPEIFQEYIDKYLKERGV